jgi:hypothetical protein
LLTYLNHGRLGESLPVHHRRQEVGHSIRFAGGGKALEGTRSALQLGVFLARGRQRGRGIRRDLVGAGVCLLVVHFSSSGLCHAQCGGDDRLSNEHQGIQKRGPFDELDRKGGVCHQIRLRLAQEARPEQMGISSCLITRMESPPRDLQGRRPHNPPDLRRWHAGQVGQIGIGHALRQWDVCEDLEFAQPLETSE